MERACLVLGLLLACASACGERAAAPLDGASDARRDAALPDGSIDDDAPIFPEAAVLHLLASDQLQPDVWFPDHGSLADALTLSKWSAVAFKTTGHMGAYVPSSATSELKGAQLTVTTWSLKGPNTVKCKTSVTAQQIAPLLVAADKVSWSTLLPSYAPGGGSSCGNPGPTETLSVTLTAKSGGVSTAATTWCPNQSGPGIGLQLPALARAFVDAVNLFEAQVCKNP